MKPSEGMVGANVWQSCLREEQRDAGRQDIRDGRAEVSRALWVRTNPEAGRNAASPGLSHAFFSEKY